MPLGDPSRDGLPQQAIPHGLAVLQQIAAMPPQGSLVGLGHGFGGGQPGIRQSIGHQQGIGHGFR